MRRIHTRPTLLAPLAGVQNVACEARGGLSDEDAVSGTAGEPAACVPPATRADPALPPRSTSAGRSALVGLVALIGLACSDEHRSANILDTRPVHDDGAGSTASHGAEDEVTSAPAASDASDVDDDAGANGGPKLDVSNQDPPTPTAGCKKIDFLFVVDNSSSMLAHQAALAASFPGFIAAIADQVGTDDFHIMAIDSDAKADPNDGCGECYERCVEGIAKDCGFSDPSDTGAPGICNGQTCMDISPEAPDACDYALGAGIVDDRWEQSCPLDGEHRYIEGGQADLVDTFECVARAGVYGTGKELVLGAMTEALAMNDAGQCNEGFVRDDAILVVTLLSDAVYEPGGPWVPGTGDPQGWYDALVDAKAGDPEAIVVLGLLNTPSIPGGGCDWPSASSDAYLDFIEMFGPRGFAHTICVDDFAGFFASSLETIDTTCDDFRPEG